MNPSLALKLVGRPVDRNLKASRDRLGQGIALHRSHIDRADTAKKANKSVTAIGPIDVIGCWHFSGRSMTDHQARQPGSRLLIAALQRVGIRRFPCPLCGTLLDLRNIDLEHAIPAMNATHAVDREIGSSANGAGRKSDDSKT